MNFSVNNPPCKIRKPEAFGRFKVIDLYRAIVDEQGFVRNRLMYFFGNVFRCNLRFKRFVVCDFDFIEHIDVIAVHTRSRV